MTKSNLISMNQGKNLPVRSTKTKLPNHDPKSSKSLQDICTSILRERYDLQIEIPNNKLIPMVNNRLTYINWLHELVTGRSELLKERRNRFNESHNIQSMQSKQKIQGMQDSESKGNCLDDQVSENGEECKNNQQDVDIIINYRDDKNQKLYRKVCESHENNVTRVKSCPPFSSSLINKTDIFSISKDKIIHNTSNTTNLVIKTNNTINTSNECNTSNMNVNNIDHPNLTNISSTSIPVISNPINSDANNTSDGTDNEAKVTLETQTTPNCRGIDIGTGSTSIYALLGFKEYGWRFVCTECDEQSYLSACNNVYTLNKISPSDIDIRKVNQSDPLLKEITKEDGFFDFTVCNPPFFDSEEHAQASQNRRRVCPGSASELWCPGGEYQFLVRLVDESLRLKDQIGIFSSWIGRKSTLKRIRQYLYSRKITMQYHTEFLEGLQYRWGIAWIIGTPEETHQNSEIMNSYIATYRYMRHCIPQGLSSLHSSINQVIDQLKSMNAITKVTYDKYTGNYEFQIPTFESQSTNNVNIQVRVEMKSIPSNQTLIQIECADFHTQAYQNVYSHICKSILN